MSVTVTPSRSAESRSGCRGLPRPRSESLRLEVDLQRRLDAKGLAAPWPDLMRDLARLQAVIVDLDGTRYRLRTDCQGHAAKAFQAAGVAIPTAVIALGPIQTRKPPQPPHFPCSDKKPIHRLTA
jgi:hypothetical protein